MGPIVLTQVATGLSVLAGAALVKSVMDQKPMAGPFQRCPTCNGTGRVTCICSRWSDGDVGCATCAGSGRRACSSCGGSGTGRPLPVQISINMYRRFSGSQYVDAWTNSYGLGLVSGGFRRELWTWLKDGGTGDSSIDSDGSSETCKQGIWIFPILFFSYG
ncbi:hypothetical protein PTKIN_Ptkin02bG0062300 [Pterospermum kingtungense]